MTADESPIKPQHFCTDDHQARHRLALLREHYGRHLAGMDIAPPRGEDFRLSARTLHLPGVIVHSGGSSALLFERTSALMQDANDDLAVIILSAPSRFQSKAGSDLPLAGGEAVLVPFDQEWKWAHGAVKVLCLRIPRSALPPRARPSRSASAQIVPKDAPALRLLSAYAQTLLALDRPLSAASGHLAAKHLRDLFADILQSDASGAPEDGASMAEARLAVMKRDIERHLDDLAVDVRWLAARHGVTPRYVQMLFERDGTTFSEYVRLRKLEMAHRMLSDPAGAHRRVGEIALDAGFSDISNFNRAFRRHYGVTPTELRAEALKRTAR